MKKVIGFAMALAIMSVAGSISAAVKYTYSGLGASGSWTDPANWTASDGSTSGYPGVETTDIAVFPKDAGPVAFDFGNTELTIGELNVKGGTSDVTAEITLKNVTMTVASKILFDVGTSVKLTGDTSLAAGSSSTSDPTINGTFVVDTGCVFTAASNRYCSFGAKAVIRIAGKMSMPERVTYTSGAQIILEGGEYCENIKATSYASQTRDLSFVTGNGVFNKRDSELTFVANTVNRPVLAPGVTYVWNRGTGGSDARMNLTCGTIEFFWQTAGNSQFYSTAKRSGFNFAKHSTAKVVFSQYTPASIEEMFATELFSPGSSANGPHIYVEGAAVKSAEQLKELFDIKLPYADGKGVALSLKNTMPAGASVLAAPPLPVVTGNEVAFSGSFLSLGSGTTTVSLEWWVDAVPEVTNVVEIASLESTATDLSFAKTLTFADWPAKVNWRFVSANGSGDETFSDATESLSVGIRDTATYTWKAGVSSGRWADSENWTASTTPCRGYPNTSEATASFSDSADVSVDCSGLAILVKTLSLANGRGKVTLSGGSLSVARIDVGTSAAAACTLDLENGLSLDFLGGTITGGNNANIWGKLVVGEGCSFYQRSWALDLKSAGEKVVVENGAELSFLNPGTLNFASADARIRMAGGTVRRNIKIAYNSNEFAKFQGYGLVEWNQFQFVSAGGVTSDLTIPEGMTFSFACAEYGSGSVVNLLGDGRLCFRYGLSDHPNGAFWDVNRFNLSSESKMKVELPNYSEMTWRQVYDLLFSPEAADGKYYFLLDGAAVTSALAFRKSILVESPMEGAEKGVCFGWKTPLGLMLILR